jgi:hypothetical protein
MNEKKIIGVGVGKQTHTLFLIKGECVENQFISNDEKGLHDLIELSTNNDHAKIVFSGNKRWCMPMACGLREYGITPYYLAIKNEKGARGKKGRVDKILLKTLELGGNFYLFFPEVKEEKELPTTYRVAMEYIAAADLVRQLKHHLLDCLAVLFPEVVKALTITRGKGEKAVDLPVPQPQPPDLYAKKMKIVLNNPDPFFLETAEGVPEVVKTLAKNSLGRFIPKEFIEKTKKDYFDHLEKFRAQSEVKDKKMEEIKELVKDHLLVQEYGDGDTVAMIIAFLGWRTWPHWRELRRFVGLAVTRVDSGGKSRISRVRPEIRQYLYLFMTLTKAGKEMVSHMKGKNRVKRLERVVKNLRLKCLK